MTSVALKRIGEYEILPNGQAASPRKRDNI